MTILQPVVVLAGWTMVMWAWMIGTRLPALRAKGIRLTQLRGGHGRAADGVLDERAQWKAHNYNHLMEQPTVFYAVALTLFATDGGAGPAALLAWLYALLRIAHSMVQAVYNRVIVRFALFVASSLCLAALCGLAAIAVF